MTRPNWGKGYQGATDWGFDFIASSTGDESEGSPRSET